MSILKNLAHLLEPKKTNILGNNPPTTPPFVGEWNQQPKLPEIPLSNQPDRPYQGLLSNLANLATAPPRLPEIPPSEQKPSIIAQLGQSLTVPPKLPEIPIQANNAPIGTEMAQKPLAPLPTIGEQPNRWGKLAELINQPIQTHGTQPAANPLDNFPIGGERPRLVENQQVNDITPEQLRESQKTQAEIQAIQNKDYGFQRDEQGNILRDENGKKIYAKDRDKDHDWKDILKGVGIGLLQGAGSGNGLGGILGGGIAGGVASGIDRNFDEKFVDRQKIGNLQNVYGQQTAAEADDLAYRTKETQRQTILNDDARLADVAKNNDEVRRADLLRKQQKDASDAENDKLTRESKNIDRLANLYNRLPSFDPADPKNASLVKQMQAAGLPVVKKDSPKDIRFERDYRTGETYQIVTDKQTGKEIVKALTKADGSPLAPTPQVIVAGENAARVADINQQGATSRNNANITSREGIADANRQQKATLLQEKIEASKSGKMKPAELMKAVQNNANKKMISISASIEEFRKEGFNVDILK